MTDEQFLGQLARTPALPAKLRAEVERRQMKLAGQRVHAARLGRAVASPDETTGVSELLPTCSVGAIALGYAVRQPGRWVRLPRGRTAKVWRVAIAQAVQQIEDKFDAGLAETLSERQQGQGTHLRTVADDQGSLVEILWQPALDTVAAQ